MHESTTMSDWSKSEREFAKAIIDIVENRYKKYERDFQEGKIEHVPLENIHFGTVDLKAFPHVMQEIKRYQKPESTIREMLGLLSSRNEIIYSQGNYKLTKHGLLHRHLTEKLERTS